MTSVAAELEHMDIQQQYSDGVNNRWDADDWDNENSSARLFERSRIKALAGRTFRGLHWVHNWRCFIITVGHQLHFSIAIHPTPHLDLITVNHD